MPDKMMERVIEDILEKAGQNIPTEEDVEFVETVDTGIIFLRRCCERNTLNSSTFRRTRTKSRAF